MNIEMIRFGQKGVMYEVLKLKTKRLIYAILLGLLIISNSNAQTWKGGNTADYDANSVCSDVYLLHRDGTTFPGDTRAECCIDTVLSSRWIIYIDDSTVIPYPPGYVPETTYAVVGSVYVFDSTWVYDTVYSYGDTLFDIDSVYFYNYDTVYSAAETLYSFDTTWVMGNNGIYFTTFTTYMCESLLTAIDTTQTPDESLYCTYCDSILNSVWFSYVCTSADSCDSFEFDTWRTLTPYSEDRCDLIPHSSIIIPGARYWGDSVFIGDRYYTGFYVKDTISDVVTRIEYDDTLYLGSSHAPTETGGGIGVFVKSCDCVVAAETLVTDSAAVMLCISTDWFARTSNDGMLYREAYDEGQVMPSYYSDDYYDFARCGGACTTREQFYESTYWTVMRSDDVGYSGGHANNAYYIDHLIPSDYGDDILNLVDSLFPGGRVFTLIGDSTITPPKRAFFFDFDTTAESHSSTYGMRTGYGCFTADTLTSYRWHDTTNYSIFPTKPHASYKFFNWIHFNEILTSEEIAGLNANQPDWIVIPMADDGVPYISIGDSTYWIMDDDSCYYNAMSYRISPDSIRYDLPVYVETGVYSDFAPFVGSQVLIALDYGIIGDTVITSCVEFEDTITLPECYDCDDSICFKFPQGMIGQVNTGGADIGLVGNNINEVVVCFSTCELDTLDVSGNDHGAIYTLPRTYSLMSSDSTDTFTIMHYNDSLIIEETGTIPIEIRSDVEMGSSELRFYDTAKDDTTMLYQTADTFHISTNDTSVIVKIGSGSLYMSDKALWFGGNYIDHNVYGFALGEMDTVTGSYGAAWGLANNASGVYSTVWGLANSATYNYATCWGSYSTATNSGATAFGENTTASGNRSTSWGLGCISSGSTSTSFGVNSIADGNSSLAFGNLARTYADNSVVSGRNIMIDSLADCSFFIGLNDTLEDDSTFCSSYPHNEIRGDLKIDQNGTAINKIIKIGSHLAFICGDDTLWAVSDTSRIY